MQQGPRSIVPFFHNLVEPTELIQHFQKSPPEDFLVLELASKVPAFSMKFDLFTTMETATRRKLEALPFSRWWRRLLHPYTCFVGTTVSEYAPFPISTPPEALIQELLADKMDIYPFLIIKDISINTSSAHLCYSQGCSEYSYPYSQFVPHSLSSCAVRCPWMEAFLILH